MLDIFRIADGAEMNDDLLLSYINQNDTKTNTRYDALWNAYNNDYDIFHLRQKPSWKPDNRLSVNFARYIADTFIGFSYGIPVRVVSDDEPTQEYINDLNDATDADDLLTELATATAIFGRAYRIAFVDESCQIGSAFLDPRESFMIYSEGITPKPRYFVRTYMDSENIRRGSISDEYSVKYFHLTGGEITWDDVLLHGFGCVPAVECVMNRARRGIFEDVLPLINSYNKALSEKANDVDYFSDSYMKILGAALDQESIRFMRENRVINLAGKGGADVSVDFLAKPSADGTQENLLDRLERQIFTIAMVCNISDENFATTSGIALKYKLLPMVNLASAAWRKMAHALDSFYRIVCASPVCPLAEDAWQTLTYIHTLNYPTNLADEAATAATLSGIVSKRTQLATLSIVDDVDSEMERLTDEAEQEATYITPYETSRTAAEDDIDE
jgi:SPP1 family phage portal protein